MTHTHPGTVEAPRKQRVSSAGKADGSVSRFIRSQFRHFNAATLVDAADAYSAHLAGGGKMFMTIAGAMSTAELGISLAEMIRQDKVQAITCTGANLEEDIFNLVAHDYYERVPNYRDLTPADEQDLLDRHMNRVTDTCIPEMEAMRRIEKAVLDEWVAADKRGERFFPHEFMYRILRNGSLEGSYQIDPKNSWLGGFHAGQHVRRPRHLRRGEECSYSPHRHRIHDDPGRLVHEQLYRRYDRLLPDRRRHRRRLSDLRRSHAPPGSA